MNLTVKILIVLYGFLFSQNPYVNYAWELFEYSQSAENAALGGAVYAYQNKSSTSINNPIFSSVKKDNFSITHQNRYSGMLSSDFISFDLNNNKKNINLNFIYENIGSIPNTKNTLLDWGNDGQYGTNDFGEGNGILDSGERLDLEKISFFNQKRLGFYGAFLGHFFNYPVGLGFKIISTELDQNLSFGIGFDIGIIKNLNKLDYAIIIENFPSSGILWNDGSIEKTLPSVKIGINKYYKFKELEYNFLFAEKISLSDRHLDTQIRMNDYSMDLSFGFQLAYKRRLHLRFGRNQVNNLAGGVGFLFQDFQIDYAFLNTAYNYNLGSHHIFSFHISNKWIFEWIKNL
jgi:hypothetical protein